MKLLCENKDSIPTVEDIVEMTQDEHFLVLNFPDDFMSDSETKSLIAKLKTKLPEHYNVFKSSSTRLTSITIMTVISQLLITQNIDSIVEAINDYLALNHELLNRNSPDLYESWELCHAHGDHNRYIHKLTNQKLEASDFPIAKLNQIDPHFWGEFVLTATHYEDLKDMIHQVFHDSSRILDYIRNNYILTDEHKIVPSSSVTN